MGSNSASQTAGKPIRCQAAVCRKAGEPLIIEEIEGPASAFPRILGHEAAGVVESVGENVEEVKEGDIVIPVFQTNCGECRDCKCPKGNICSKFPEVFFCGMPRDGSSSFSEYTVVDVTHVVKMSPDFPIDKASLLSCGVSTGLGAAWNVAEVEEGSTVAIFGLGAVGLVGTGKTVILGIEMHGTPLSINPYELAAGKTIMGSMFGGVKAKVDIPIFAAQYLNNELNLEGFITHEVNFEDINKAFDLLQAGKTLRCIIWMDK
ncbi:putative alcohol dehydrogenase-like 1-like [Capsicum annuum]|nr:putative alcohol dehydrogenase-like 1-like [Capsicum annuum]